MKKIKILILVCLLAILPLAFAGCSKTALNVPTGIYVDDDLKLSWQAVKGARRYEVEITSAESGEIYKTENTRKPYVSLAKLEEGDYVIRVKSVAYENDGENQDSAWSESIEFQKGYETGCIYKLIHNDTEYELIRAGTSSGTFVIADSFRGKPVVSIGDGAFNGSGRIENVQIGGSRIEYIGNNAFYNCPKLESVVIPDSVTYLGERAFQSCRSLTSIKLSANLKEILPFTFAYCGRLTQITLPETLTSIGESAFSDCYLLKEIVIPSNVKTLGDYAFAACSTVDEETNETLGLEKVVLGASLETIGEYAFSKCAALKTVEFASDYSVKVIDSYAFMSCYALKSIDLPLGLTTIGRWAFLSCRSLEDIIIPSSVTAVGENPFGGTAFFIEQVSAGETFIYADKWLVGFIGSKELNKTVTYKSDTQPDEKLRLRTDIVGLSEMIFAAAPDVDFTSINLPKSVKYIGKNAFRNNTALVNFAVQDNSQLKEIGNYAFCNCINLRTIILGKGLKSIGAYAFYGCAALNSKEGILPETVTSIGVGAFKGTSAWNNSSDENGLIYVGNWVVGYNKLASSSITFKEGTVGISDYAFEECEDITSANMANVRYVGKGSFLGCTKLTSVFFNRDLDTIADYAFYGCSSLSSITFTSNITSIGRSAFYKCTSLVGVNLSKTEVEEIGEYAFYGCVSLKNLELSKKLTSIPEYAFYGCSSLEQISIPQRVESIGARAFYKCSSATALTFAADSSLAEIGDSAFYKCEALASIDLPENLEVVGDKAFYNCVNAQKLDLNKVKKVGDYAFYGNAALTSIHIPSSVTSVGKFAFKGAALAKSVIVPASVEKLGAHVFYGLKESTFWSNASNLLGEWDKYWNSSFRPVVWGCVLSDTGDYVVSVTLGDGVISNANAKGGLADPERAGYLFAGWSKTSPNGSVDLTTEQLVTAETNTVLYAVWQAEE